MPTINFDFLRPSIHNTPMDRQTTTLFSAAPFNLPPEIIAEINNYLIAAYRRENSTRVSGIMRGMVSWRYGSVGVIGTQLRSYYSACSCGGFIVRRYKCQEGLDLLQESTHIGICVPGST